MINPPFLKALYHLGLQRKNSNFNSYLGYVIGIRKHEIRHWVSKPLARFVPCRPRPDGNAGDQLFERQDNVVRGGVLPIIGFQHVLAMFIGHPRVS